MNLKLVILILMLLIISCNKEIVEKPENLISEDKMVNILFDISIIKACKIGSIKSRSLNHEVIFSEEYIYKKYQIDSSQLSQSNIYYASKSDLHAKIFNEVLERLEAEKKLLVEQSDSLKIEIDETKRERRKPFRKDSITTKKDSL